MGVWVAFPQAPALYRGLSANPHHVESHGPFRLLPAPTRNPGEGVIVHAGTGYPGDETGQKTDRAHSGPIITRLLWQVNRYLRDFIQNSPPIAYQIDIFAAGLKDNPIANLSLAEKRRLFNEYRARWDAFDPIGKSNKSFDGPRHTPCWMSSVCGSGVFCLVTDPDKFIRLTKIESVSRGIPRKEWKVPSPRDLEPLHFAIYPQADVLAVIGSGGGYALQCYIFRTY